MAVLRGDGLMPANAYGGEAARLQFPGVRAVGFAGASLATATSREVRTHRIARSGNVDLGELRLQLGTRELLGSPTTGSLFARHAQAGGYEIGPDDGRPR